MSDASGDGAVYCQTNEPQNRVVVFRRGADGALAEHGSYGTGGAGDGHPHLPSQGSVTLTGDGRHLLVTNVASDDVSVFAVLDDGRRSTKRPDDGAARPAASPSTPGWSTSSAPAPRRHRLPAERRRPEADRGRRGALSAPDADPAQVGFTPDGSRPPRHRAGDELDRRLRGRRRRDARRPRSIASSGPTPYGFADHVGGTLVVTEAFGAEKGAAAASSYRVDGADVTPVTQSVGNGRSEICWAVVTPDGRTRSPPTSPTAPCPGTGSGTDGSLTLGDATAGITEDGRPGSATWPSRPTGVSCTPSTPTRAALRLGGRRRGVAARLSAPRRPACPPTAAGLTAP